MLFKEIDMDKYFMEIALKQAKEAREILEVPIGITKEKHLKIH